MDGPETASLAEALQSVSTALRQLKTVKDRQVLDQQHEDHDDKASLRSDKTEKSVFEKGEALEVFTELFIQRIFSLDTKAQRFGTHLTVMMKWKCPPTEDPPLPEEDDGDWEPKWTPKYQVRLLVEETQVEKLFSIQVINGEKWIMYEGNHLIYIFEELELWKFPTDTQDLNIVLHSALPTTRVKWVPMNAGAPFVTLSKEHFYLTDFMLSEVPLVHNMCTRVTLNTKVSSLEVQVKVVRRLGYYMTNVALVMCMICSCILTSWATHPADESARQSVDFNIILTAVAYKLVLTGMLPPVSYMTLLDIYVLGCFLFIAAVTISHVAVPLEYVRQITNSPLSLPVNGTYETEEALIDDDHLTFTAFACLWVAWNVFCLGYLLVVRKMDVDRFVREAKQMQKEFDEESDEVKGPLGSDAVARI